MLLGRGDEYAAALEQFAAREPDQDEGAVGVRHRLDLQAGDFVVEVDVTPGPLRRSAKLQAVALAWVLQMITDEMGRRAQAGQTPGAIADDLGPIVNGLIDSLDRWLAPAP